MPCSPFFDEVSIRLPGAPHPLVIKAPGASQKPYIKSLHLNGRPVRDPIIRHSDIASGGTLEFTMSSVPTTWGKRGKSLGEGEVSLFMQLVYRSMFYLNRVWGIVLA